MIDGSYYQQLLKTLSVAEKAVDCSQCQMEFKCCTYRPFIANFLVGAFCDDETLFNQELFNEWDFLIVGLSPNLKYRKYFFKKGKWGFGTDSHLLCSFYEKKNGGCRIWKARPAVCRTFFCKSSYNEGGAFYWKSAEEFTWRLEWVLLEEFLYHKGWSLEEVAEVKGYLDDSRGGPQRNVPREYCFEDIAVARDFYREAKSFMESMSEAHVMEILGEEGRREYDELVEQKSKLG